MSKHLYLKDIASLPYSPADAATTTICDPNNKVCDYATYTQLLQENAELHRANRLLQAVVSPNNNQNEDNEDSNRQWELLKTELMVAESRARDLEVKLIKFKHSYLVKILFSITGDAGWSAGC